MTIRSVLGVRVANRRGGWLALGLFSFLLASCDKDPEGPTPGPRPVSSKSPVAAPSPGEASNQADDGAAPNSDTEMAHDEPVSAVEPGLSPAKFSEGASLEFKGAFERLDQWATARGGKVHAAFVDLESDQWLLRSRAQELVNPASNAKILTAAAALELLGPAHRFATELRGAIAPDGSCARLALIGGGAPDFTTADLWRLLRVAQGEGLTKVENIVVDQSRFSAAYVPPAFDQQPNEWAPFRAPISALSLNENTITLNVSPTKTGKPARIWYDPPGVVQAEGQVATGASGMGDRVAWNLDVKADKARPISRVAGSLAEGLGRRRYERRMEDPRLAPGHALRALLGEVGIEVKGGVTAASAAKEPRIALWYSEPVAELVRALGKDSDNFVAEMLFVALSSAQKTGPGNATSATAKKDEPWSAERGAQVMKAWLADAKIELGGGEVRNGSGLFDANRMSAELLVRILSHVEDNPRIFQDFVSHLAMGATDGTMKSRMSGSDLGQRVRAKTGTLNQVDALSGYIQRPAGRSPGAFSIIVVGAKAGHGEVRNKVDELVLTWAKILG